MIQFRKADAGDIEAVTELLMLLYNDVTEDELYEENEMLLENDGQAIFLATDDDIDEEIGVAHCSVRNDYVEGAGDFGDLTGYLEGVFVLPEYRRRGIARELLRMCEEWAKDNGCNAFASDCELDNEESYYFHVNTGFEEQNRIICFAKPL